MIERRESEMIAQDLRNQAKQRQANTQTQRPIQRPTQGQNPATPKSAERHTAANTSYNK